MSSKKRSSRFNDVFMGLNYGILAPIFAIVIIYYIQFSSRVTFEEYLNFIAEAKILSSMISLAALANLLIFFICIWTKALKAARGVVFATIIWGLIIVYLKFLA